MMKVEVINGFHDIYKFSKVYSVGDIVEFDDARGESLVNRGLARSLTEKTPKVSEEVEPKAVEEVSTEPIAEAVEPQVAAKPRGRKPRQRE